MSGAATVTLRPKDENARLIVAIDVTPLKPGGENGGLKPAVFGLLRAVADKGGDDLVFVFLTNSASHTEIRALARTNDILICVLDDPVHPGRTLPDFPGEFVLLNPPDGFLNAIEVDLLYCPFGAATYHTSTVPTIALIADLLHREFPSSLSAREISHRESYIANTIEVASKVQCISRSGVKQMLKHYDVPRQKLFWTYLPIHRRLAATEAVTRESHRPIFFYPANLWLHKNHELLLRSYAAYCKEAGVAAWDLVLTFHEDSRAAFLRSLADELGIVHHVRFAGFVDERELHEIWLKAGALVFPSLHEGFGIPLLEAMYYGVPIIAGSGFSLKEVVGDACRAIDPRVPSSVTAALLEISRDPELRRELVMRGRERLQLFNLQQTASSLLAAFRSVTQTDSSFPRRPVPADAHLTAPTPSSDARWRIDVMVRATGGVSKTFLYLDDSLFATWSADSLRAGVVSFFCRPNGRLLSVRQSAVWSGATAGNDGTRSDIATIIAHGSNRERIVLYDDDD